MWNRKELKANAKVSLKANYWVALVASLILLFLGGGLTSYGTGANAGKNANAELAQEGLAGLTSTPMEYIVAILAVALGIVLIAGIIGALNGAFISNPLIVGAQKVFINCKDNTAQFGDIGFAFKNSYLNVVKISFLKNLFIWLWTLLFVIPGIIKSYEYRMIDYILAEHPDMDRKEVFALSKEMMTGNKWKAFVMDLSFLGWHFLGAITLGIVEIFYAAPYNYLADAELYLALKDQFDVVEYSNTTYDDGYRSQY